MKSFDEVTQRLTEKLKIDPELRAEVGNELRGHLEESAREFVKAGRGEEEAHSEAVRAMGDEAEVATGLWEGNKRRVRNRRVARWVVGGTLVPAAGALAVSLTWGVVVSVGVLLATLYSFRMYSYKIGWEVNEAAQKISRHVREGELARVPEPARRLFEANVGDAESRVMAARELAMARPRDRVYWAHYVGELVEAGAYDIGAGSVVTVNQEKLKRVMEAIEEGERIEPGNGFYPLAKAEVLVSLGAQNMRPEKDSSIVDVRYTSRSGKEQVIHVGGWEITDDAMYERGMAALMEAAGKSYIATHETEFGEARLAALPAPTRVGDELWRSVSPEQQQGTVMGRIDFAVWMGGEDVLRLARAGRIQEAQRIIRAERRVSRLMTEGATQIYDWYSGAWTYEHVLAQQAAACQVVGNTAGQTQAIAQINRLEKTFYPGGSMGEMEAQAVRAQQHAGWLDGYFARWVTDSRMLVFGPEREAEYAMMDQLGVAGWVVILLMAALCQGLAAVARRVRTGRWPGMVFVGWGRLGWILAVAVGGSIGVYWVYAYLAGVGREWGPMMVGDRLAVEYAVVGGMMAVALRLMWERAMKRREREMGIQELGRGFEVSRFNMAIGMMLAAGVVGYLVYWHREVGRSLEVESPTHGWGFWLAGLVAGYGASWLWPAEGRGRFRGWMAWLMVFGMVGGIPWLATWKFTYLWLPQIYGMTALLVGIVLAIAVGMMALRKRKEEERGGFGLGISMTPVMLGAAVMLGLVAGTAGRMKERSAVRAMAATGVDVRFAHDAAGRGNPLAVKLMLEWQRDEAPAAKEKWS